LIQPGSDEPHTDGKSPVQSIAPSPSSGNRHPGRPATNRHLRAPTVTGFAIVLIAAAAVAIIVALDRTGGDPQPTAALPTATAAPIEGIAARAILTTNLRVAPGRQSDIVAIVPTNQLTRVTGRSADGIWLRVAYPPDSELAGWGARDNFEVLSGDLATVAVASPGASTGTGPAASATPIGKPLPDLALIDAYLLPNGDLTVVVENVGTGRFSGSIGLQVTTGGGELLGVFDIQETTLLPNRTATVNTQLTIAATGSYLIELDRLDRIEELSEFNNATRVFLVPTS